MKSQNTHLFVGINMDDFNLVKVIVHNTIDDRTEFNEEISISDLENVLTTLQTKYRLELSTSVQNFVHTIEKNIEFLKSGELI